MKSDTKLDFLHVFINLRKSSQLNYFYGEERLNLFKSKKTLSGPRKMYIPLPISNVSKSKSTIFSFFSETYWTIFQRSTKRVVRIWTTLNMRTKHPTPCTSASMSITILWSILCIQRWTFIQIRFLIFNFFKYTFIPLEIFSKFHTEKWLLKMAYDIKNWKNILILFENPMFPRFFPLYFLLFRSGRQLDTGSENTTTRSSLENMRIDPRTVDFRCRRPRIGTSIPRPRIRSIKAPRRFMGLPARILIGWLLFNFYPYLIPIPINFSFKFGKLSNLFLESSPFFYCFGQIKWKFVCRKIARDAEEIEYRTLSIVPRWLSFLCALAFLCAA